MTRMQERRSTKRYPLELYGYAIVNGCNIGLRTRDISQGGGLVRLATHVCLRTGTKLLIRFDIGVMGRAIICRTGFAEAGGLYSIRFDRFDSYSDLILIAHLIRYEQHLPAGKSIQ